MQGGRGSGGGAMGGSRLMSVRCGEWRWPKSVVNGLAGMEVRGAGKVREMEARVLFLVANQLILYNLAETLGMPGDAPSQSQLTEICERAVVTRGCPRWPCRMSITLAMKMLASLRSAGDRHRFGMSDRHHRNAQPFPSQNANQPRTEALRPK